MDDVPNASKFYDQNAHSLEDSIKACPICGTEVDRFGSSAYLTRLINSEVE